MKLYSLNLLFVVVLLNAPTAQSMCGAQLPVTSRQSKLDSSLWYACEEIVCCPTWSELAAASLHCKSVTTQRLADIEHLLKAGANPNKITTSNIKSGTTIGLTPLHWAVTNNSPRLVALLLKHKADVNVAVKNERDLRSLEIAMKNYEFIQKHRYLLPTEAHGYLLPTKVKGYKVWQRTETRALYPAARRDNLKIGNMLRNAGAKPVNLLW